MNPFVLFFRSLCVCLLLACQPGGSQTERASMHPPAMDGRVLSRVKKEGKLSVLTTYSNTSYFLYKGKPMGFEYELLERFAEHLGVGLELHLSNDIDRLLDEVKHDSIDLVAHGMAITTERKKEVLFTDYLYLTHQVLVQKKPDNWRNMSWSQLQRSLVHDAIELIGDTVSVRANSSYVQRIQHLSREIGGEIVIDTLPGHLSTDEIIQMVVRGDIKYTVADDNIARINQSYYPILNIEVPVSFSQRIAWAVSPEAPQLAQAVNEWLKEMKDEVDYYVIYNKYFKNTKNFRKRVQSEFSSLNENRISPYDSLIQVQADSLGWDWRLLASLVYQESRFDPRATSWASAHGLMQLMPATARAFGVNSRTNPAQNLKGGRRYLQQLWDRFEDIPDSVQRIKFTMASYNCGYGHVLDAQRLAKARKLDPHRWDESVENMILELSDPGTYRLPEVKYGYVRGREPYTYVQQIFQRYEHYQKFIDGEGTLQEGPTTASL